VLSVVLSFFFNITIYVTKNCLVFFGHYEDAVGWDNPKNRGNSVSNCLKNWGKSVISIMFPAETFANRPVDEKRLADYVLAGEISPRP